MYYCSAFTVFVSLCIYLDSNKRVVYCTSLYSYNKMRMAFKGQCYEEDCSQAHFSYETGKCHGPNFWHKITPCWRGCSANSQSPINIRTRTTSYRRLHRLRFENLCTRVDGSIRNNGHSPLFETESKSVRLVNVPNFYQRKFIFKEMHIHRGQRQQKGSEHSVDGEFYPMEAHMVFYDGRFNNITEARDHPGGLAVIGVMIEINNQRYEKHRTKRSYNNRNPYYRQNWTSRVLRGRENSGQQKSYQYRDPYNYKIQTQRYNNYHTSTSGCEVRYSHKLSSLMEKYYTKIKKHFPENSPEGMSEVHVQEGISPEDALPYDWSFYTYSGSLTTPPCSETVQWIVMRCPVKVSDQSFQTLGQVEDVNKHPLSKYGIRRPIQRGNSHYSFVQIDRNFKYPLHGIKKSFC